MSSVEGAGTASKIHLFDLARQNMPIADELLAAVAQVAGAQGFVLGATVSDFEESVAQYLGVSHSAGVASGTDALYLALRLLDLEPGDEVVTSPFTFFASAGAIANAGGRVVLADIDPRTFNLDPGSVAAAVTDRTRAIIPVHLFGRAVDLCQGAR
jgi:dTDP-4-amino-4,6-dideoxygalactose transaminase